MAWVINMFSRAVNGMEHQWVWLGGPSASNAMMFYCLTHMPILNPMQPAQNLVWQQDSPPLPPQMKLWQAASCSNTGFVLCTAALWLMAWPSL